MSKNISDGGIVIILFVMFAPMLIAMVDINVYAWSIILNFNYELSFVTIFSGLILK